MAEAPSPPMRRPVRLGAFAALALAVVAVGVVALTRDHSHTYRLQFADAGQLVKGDLVRVGGVQAGTVTGISLTDDDQAQITVSVDDRYAPLHRGTTATVRAQSLIGVANRYVDISPGPNFREEMADGAVLGSDDSTSIVDLDQLFNTLDPKTRRGLQGFIKGSAGWYRGREALANDSARYFAPALGATARLAREVDRDSGSFQRFLVETAQATRTIAQRRGELTDLIGNTQRTAGALGSRSQSLDQALRELPPALRQGSTTMAALRPAIGDLQRLTDTAGPATRDLAPFLSRLAPVTREAAPRFGQLRTVFDRPGTDNDLYDALVDLPSIGRQARGLFPRGRRALRESTPILSFSRPYVPDLTSFVAGFGRAAATYDANGHYVRTLPIFDAFTFDDDAQGGSFAAKPLAARGSSPFLRTGNLQRCPGAGVRTADGSSNFVDIGQLANADCDPAQRVGG